MGLEQRHIIRFLSSKDLKLDSIATDLSGPYGQDASEQASTKFWMHQLKLGRTDLTAQHADRRPALDDTDTEIVSVPGNARCFNPYNCGGSAHSRVDGILPFSRKDVIHKPLAPVESGYVDRGPAVKASPPVKRLVAVCVKPTASRAP
jgi:hypothetical protein